METLRTEKHTTSWYGSSKTSKRTSYCTEQFWDQARTDLILKTTCDWILVTNLVIIIIYKTIF